MSTKFGLKPEVIKSINQIVFRYPVEKIIIYGSRAMDSHRNGSDIDLTLVGPSLSITQLLAILTDLEELDLPYKIDLSLYHLIDNPSLLEHINRVGVKFVD